MPHARGQVEIAKNYGRNEWREDLKKVLKRAGGEGKPTVFLFSDTQVRQWSFRVASCVAANLGLELPFVAATRAGRDMGVSAAC
jgi:hypothetical protein